VVVPDGATGEDQQNEDPGTPEEQINQEVAVSQVTGWLSGLLGTNWQQSSGGGGEGGQFMFANLAELDAVINAWRDEIDAMIADQDQIRSAQAVVDSPAGDSMSRFHTSAVKQTLDALGTHSDQLFRYAEEYLMKLVKTRQQMQNDEDAAEASMRNVHPA